jgi:uncharacterized protein (UPF0276 family)
MPTRRDELKSTLSRPTSVPPRVGVGLKPAHYASVLQQSPVIGFFEVHAENYMGAGGPPHRYLEQIRSRYPLSLHGVGLSIGADRPLDRAHLQRLAELNRRYEPGLFSEHLAWSSDGRYFYNDLLPVPYSVETLQRVCEHIHQVQDSLARQMLLENPATYLMSARSSYSEVGFIREVTRRTGCALLLDVNNVHVACTNHRWDPTQYIDEFPLASVQQIHLAGHAEDVDQHGRRLLIDSHDRPVAEPVWALYRQVIDRIGATPTLIEWDAQLPDWAQLYAEAQRAERMQQASARMVTARSEEGAHAVAG